jgi:DNA (cytosine-5)-methyltransferase 1
MYFDGVLSVGDTRCFVQRVPFRELPVAGYGVEDNTVSGQIWVRSLRNEKNKLEIYYRLTTPSVEYARFFKPFLWVADLAKHFCRLLQVEVRDWFECHHLRFQNQLCKLVTRRAWAV